MTIKNLYTEYVKEDIKNRKRLQKHNGHSQKQKTLYYSHHAFLIHK